MKKTRIDLCDTNQIVILKNFIGCTGCIPDFIDKYGENKQIIIVSVVNKDLISIRSEDKTLNKYVTDKTMFYYQFSKKENSYRYDSKNKLFKDFKHKESPILLKNGEGGKIQIISLLSN